MGITILKGQNGNILRTTGSILRHEFIDFYPVKYGLLYNWYAATNASPISANGWHIPIFTEITTLITYLGGNTVAGGKLKEIGYLYWNSPNTGSSNESGFNARGEGIRSQTGIFGDFKSIKYLMSSSDFSTNTLYYIIRYDLESVSSSNHSKNIGKGIRLLKDTTTLTHGQTAKYTGNDGKVYRTICIGTQEWLADNLAETKYRNGDWIAGYDSGVYTPIDNTTWSGLTSGALCAYNDDTNNI